MPCAAGAAAISGTVRLEYSVPQAAEDLVGLPGAENKLHLWRLGARGSIAAGYGNDRATVDRLSAETVLPVDHLK